MDQNIAGTIVKSHNGRLRVEDRVPGDHARGTRFVVDLPVAEENDGH
jgi:signal transduction histidine kinase